MRKAYGEALVELGDTNQDVVVLDADVSASTQTWMFAQRYPERFFNVGVAEANMINIAAGLALEGKIPFVNAFAFLISLRAVEQVRTCVCLSQTNVKLAAAYGGLSDSFDGPTHQSICDLAVMRSLPNMTVLIVADSAEVRKAVPAVAEHRGAVYFRLSRAEVPLIFDETRDFEIGKGVMLRDGDDVTVIGTGIMVSRCIEAAAILSKEGVEAQVIEIHTLKPLDEDLLARMAKRTGAIVTAEEHSIIGGLGGSVAEALTGKYVVPIERVGIRDTFAETGSYFPLLDKYGLGVFEVVEAAKKVIRRRGERSEGCC